MGIIGGVYTPLSPLLWSEVDIKVTVKVGGGVPLLTRGRRSSLVLDQVVILNPTNPGIICRAQIPVGCEFIFAGSLSVSPTTFHHDFNLVDMIYQQN